MRWGILGGSFDPIHFGHLLLAEHCREALALDHVVFVPAARSPLKQGLVPASPQARLEMLHLAIAGHPQFATSRIEIDRGGLSYTVETLAQLQQEAPARELVFILGSDAVATLPQWREPARICELAQVVFTERAGARIESWEPLERVLSSEQVAAIRARRVEMPLIEISSRDIRRRVADGRSIRFMTPRAVEKYIEAAGLYRPTASE